MHELLAGEEVFQIALELEQTGEVFYEALAIACRNQRVARLCRRLAQQERDHCRRFEQMRAAHAGDADAPAMDWEDLDFVRALINERVIPGPAQARQLAAEGRLAQMLEVAIKLEQDTVKFYSEIASAVRAEDAGGVRDIIAEERSHVRQLTDALNSLH